MAVYFVALLDVHDRDGYARYLNGAGPLLAEHGGRVLASEESPDVLEGEWPCSRTVVIEFPDRDHLDRWYGSPGYREILAHRRAAASGSTAVLAGKG